MAKSKSQQWETRRFTIGEIDRAGEILVPWWTTREAQTTSKVVRYFAALQNWRNAHDYPLNTFQVILRGRAKKLDPSAIVAQRKKRVASVINKLARYPRMKLSQMQDLGGCRAIVEDIHAVERLFDAYRVEKSLFGDDGRIKTFDYVRSPKPDGYRGIHVVGRYSALRQEHNAWDGQRIEIQIRSRLQHSFATAVETVDMFARSRLKTGGGAGSSQWPRFFALMGSAIALREKTPLVPGTPTKRLALIAELKECVSGLRVKEQLQNWADVIKELPKQTMSGAKWILLEQDLTINTLQITGFADYEQAQTELANIEKNSRYGESLDAVLVSVERAALLRAAYPNYYADTTEFIAALEVAVDQA